mgnify:CR=1 FL=1
MEKNKASILFIIFITSMFFITCVEDNDFTVPQNLGAEENLKLETIIDSIQNNQLELKSINCGNISGKKAHAFGLVPATKKPSR